MKKIKQGPESFVGDAWKEWNGRFRDDVRDFFRGELGALRRVAAVFARVVSGRTPFAKITMSAAYAFPLVVWT